MRAERCRLQPNDVAAGSPIDPEVKVEALDTLGNVLTEFDGRVRVALGSNRSRGTLSGTVRVAALSGVAFFDTPDDSGAGKPGSNPGEATPVVTGRRCWHVTHVRN